MRTVDVLSAREYEYLIGEMPERSPNGIHFAGKSMVLEQKQSPRIVFSTI
jgi:hypothetical protein